MYTRFTIEHGKSFGNNDFDKPPPPPPPEPKGLYAYFSIKKQTSHCRHSKPVPGVDEIRSRPNTLAVVIGQHRRFILATRGYFYNFFFLIIALF